MNITITAGWWLLPLAITVGSFMWAAVVSAKSQGGGYMPDPTGFFAFIGALIPSLLSWLIWSLLT